MTKVPTQTLFDAVLYQRKAFLPKTVPGSSEIILMSCYITKCILLTVSLKADLNSSRIYILGSIPWLIYSLYIWNNIPYEFN